MAWTKSPRELLALFDAVVPNGPPVERRTMFGYPAAFVGGNMFAGLHQASFILRLSAAERAAAGAEHGAAAFEPTPGRVMREYVALPPSVLADRPLVAELVRRALAYAGSLAPKARKPARKRR